MLLYSTEYKDYKKANLAIPSGTLRYCWSNNTIFLYYFSIFKQVHIYINKTVHYLSSTNQCILHLP